MIRVEKGESERHGCHQERERRVAGRPRCRKVAGWCRSGGSLQELGKERGPHKRPPVTKRWKERARELERENRRLQEDLRRNGRDVEGDSTVAGGKKRMQVLVKGHDIQRHRIRESLPDRMLGHPSEVARSKAEICKSLNNIHAVFTYQSSPEVRAHRASPLALRRGSRQRRPNGSEATQLSRGPLTAWRPPAPPPGSASAPGRRS